MGKANWQAAALAAMGIIAQASAGTAFAGGADVRLRYEFSDNWPNRGKNTVNSAYEDFYRLRTRIWGRADFSEDVGLFLRLGNEFRDYRNSHSNSRKNEFPDELYIDQLYLDWKNIGDRADLRLGRQDITEGAGRLVSDGTPGDGSRSRCFNALFAKVRFLEKSDVDLAAMYDSYRDDATLGNPHDVYDLTRIKKGSPYSKMREAGLMAYAHCNEVENVPLEFYWIWKSESRFYDGSERRPGRQFHTIGARAVPKFSERFSAEAEAAAQLGRTAGQDGMDGRNIAAWMAYSGVTYSEKSAWSSPKATAALLYLSGDRDSYCKTADGSVDNSWNPVFNRATWFSEISKNMYDQDRWSNLVYPHVALEAQPASGHKVKLQCGPMFAARKDNDASGAYRGLYAQARCDFPLLSKLWRERGELKGAVVGESLFYGDYYDTDETAATWLRFELVASF